MVIMPESYESCTKGWYGNMSSIDTGSCVPNYATYTRGHPYCFEVFLPYAKCGQIELAYQNQAGGNG